VRKIFLNKKSSQHCEKKFVRIFFLTEKFSQYGGKKNKKNEFATISIIESQNSKIFLYG
jgi:hypothetical protein